MALFVLSVVGSDRPGLTSSLAAAVLSAGGNWLESHLSRLGGLYVGSVLVELAADDVEALRAAVNTVDDHVLAVRIVSAVDDAKADGTTLQFTLVGQDRPGVSVLRRGHTPEGSVEPAVQEFGPSPDGPGHHQALAEPGEVVPLQAPGTRAADPTPEAAFPGRGPVLPRGPEVQVGQAPLQGPVPGRGRRES